MPMCSSKEAQLKDLIDVIIEKLDSGGTVTFTPHGESMMPMLRDGEDVVVLSKPKGRLHLFDIPLYRRSNGAFVLHRVIDFDRDGSYVMCGDNQFRKEHGIKDSDIIGVVTAFFRKGKPYSTYSFIYRLYVNFWYYTRVFRGAYRLAKRKAVRFLGIRSKDKKDKDIKENRENQDK